MGMYSAITYDHIYWFNVTNYHNKSPKLGVAGQIQVKHLQEFLLASTSYKQSDEMVEIVRLWSHEVFLLTNFQENTEWRRYVNTTNFASFIFPGSSGYKIELGIKSREENGCLNTPGKSKKNKSITYSPNHRQHHIDPCTEISMWRHLEFLFARR